MMAGEVHEVVSHIKTRMGVMPINQYDQATGGNWWLGQKERIPEGNQTLTQVLKRVILLTSFGNLHCHFPAIQQLKEFIVGVALYERMETVDDFTRSWSTSDLHVHQISRTNLRLAVSIGEGYS